jgi:hypothetical protein
MRDVTTGNRVLFPATMTSNAARDHEPPERRHPVPDPQGAPDTVELNPAIRAATSRLTGKSGRAICSTCRTQPQVDPADLKSIPERPATCKNTTWDHGIRQSLLHVLTLFHIEYRGSPFGPGRRRSPWRRSSCSSIRVRTSDDDLQDELRGAQGWRQVPVKRIWILEAISRRRGLRAIGGSDDEYRVGPRAPALGSGLPRFIAASLPAAAHDC